MNINELNVIKSINIDAAMENVEIGTGTFKNILDKVYANEIIPLTTNSGMIVGISYDAKTDSIVNDNIEQMKFEKAYAGKPVMSWVLAALDLKARRVVIDEIEEDGEDIAVITAEGERITITESVKKSTSYSYDSDLPEDVEISYDDLNIYGDEPMCWIESAVKNYLRQTYDHYLSGKDAAPDIELDEDEEYILVRNIHWGRKR